MSADDGASWHSARLLAGERDAKDSSSAGRAWNWVRWRAEVPLAQSMEELRAKASTLPLLTTNGHPRAAATLLVRAFDKQGRTQPRNNYAAGGYLFNGYHRVNLAIVLP